MIAAELGWMLFAARGARAADRARRRAGGSPRRAALLPLAIAQRSNRLAVPLAEESSTVLRTLQVPKQFAVGFDAPLEMPLAVVCLRRSPSPALPFCARARTPSAIVSLLPWWWAARWS